MFIPEGVSFASPPGWQAFAPGALRGEGLGALSAAGAGGVGWGCRVLGSRPPPSVPWCGRHSNVRYSNKPMNENNNDTIEFFQKQSPPHTTHFSSSFFHLQSFTIYITTKLHTCSSALFMFSFNMT